MRGGTKEALAVACLTLCVVATTTVMHLVQLARVVVGEAAQQADLIANQVYAQASRVLQHAGARDARAVLRGDPDLRGLVDASVGYSPHLVYVLIADREGRIVVHTERERELGQAVPRPELRALLGMSGLARFLRVYAEGRTYEAELPMTLDGQAFGSVRVGVSTALLSRELWAAMRQSLGLAALAVSAAWVLAVILTTLLFRPVRRLAQNVDRLRRGEFDLAAVPAARDEVGELASQLQLLSRELQSDRVNLKTLQSLISYSAKLAALGRLTSGVAHEVKNPLNAMMIHLELVKEQLDRSPEAARQSLDVIAGEVRRLDRVVQDFLRFIRPRELDLKTMDLGALLTSTATLLGAEWAPAGVRFVLALDATCPSLTADEELLRQALLNIVINACQAMPRGGTVTLATARRGDTVTVTVGDEGVGIPPEALDQIFKLYYTTKPSGSGVGLSLVFRIVQMHDGTVSVASQPGRGTRVTVELPVR